MLNGYKNVTNVKILNDYYWFVIQEDFRIHKRKNKFFAVFFQHRYENNSLYRKLKPNFNNSSYRMSFTCRRVQLYKMNFEFEILYLFNKFIYSRYLV